MIKKRRAFIIGLKSTVLTENEKFFLKKYKPWGIILFSRNIKNFSQIKKLTKEIRKIFNDRKYPIMIDQEGGKVNRLKKFINTHSLTSEYFGNLYKKDKREFKIKYNIFIKKISNILNDIGININTVPVLDLRNKNSSLIIGNRSFSSNPKIVSKLS